VTDAEIGWVAGIVDGEGCILIENATSRFRGRDYPGLRLCLRVGNTDPRLILKLEALFGGGHVRRMPGRNRRRALFTWNVSSRRAADVVRLIFPHLVIKREQAELALAFAKTLRPRGGRGRLSAQTVEQRQWLRRQLMTLHQKAPEIQDASL